MSSAEVLNPTPSHAAVEAGSLQLEQNVALDAFLSLTREQAASKEGFASWRQEAAKANVSLRHHL